MKEQNPIALSVNQVCELAGITRSHVYQLWRNNQGPRFVRIGRRRLVRRVDLENWLEGLAGALE